MADFRSCLCLLDINTSTHVKSGIRLMSKIERRGVPLIMIMIMIMIIIMIMIMIIIMIIITTIITIIMMIKIIITNILTGWPISV